MVRPRTWLLTQLFCLTMKIPVMIMVLCGIFSGASGYFPNVS